MFTGIIESRGEIVSVEPKKEFVLFRIRCDLSLSEVKIGDSIAVNGACLTAVAIDPAAGEFLADVSPETLAVTTLGLLKAGSGVNLELAMRLGDRLGGHLVAGHVDCVGRLIEKKSTGPGFLMGFAVDSTKYLIEKGSVAIDGVSLTVNEVYDNRFRVMIIPHTSLLTGLTAKRINDRVNIEYDMIGKYVERFIGRRKEDSGLSMEKLKESGFI